MKNCSKYLEYLAKSCKFATEKVAKSCKTAKCISMKKVLLDAHTHTVASGHAYSSLQEMAKAVEILEKML